MVQTIMRVQCTYFTQFIENMERKVCAQGPIFTLLVFQRKNPYSPILLGFLEVPKHKSAPLHTHKDIFS